MRHAAAWGALALMLLPAAGGGSPPGPGPRVAAHRGGALLWPENSLLAFRNALALGIDALEADVHLTADDAVVVIHDATLDRTTTGRGAVRATSLADLAPLRLRDPDGRVTDEPVPTLAALLDLVAPSRADVLVEIKVGPGGRRYPGIEERVLALLRERGLPSRAVVMAFEPVSVRRVRDLDPGVRTALLIGRRQVPGGGPAEAVKAARDLGAAAIGYHHHLVDAGVVAAARGAGLTIAAWTVNEEADMRRMILAGVDLLISDRPDLALELTRR